MHIQERNFGADIEPVYDRDTYILKHYSYAVTDTSKGNEVIFRGHAKDLKGAIAAAEKKVAKLLEESEEQLAGGRAA